MKNKTITIEGIEYNLVPVKDTLVDESVTFYYGCISDCGSFEFSILLDSDGEIWEDSQSLTYYPEHYINKINKSEIWDNTNFLIDILEGNINDEVINLRHKIGENKFNTLVNLLKQVHKKGWI